MAGQKNDIKFALEFPQGYILAMKKDGAGGDDVGGVYFQPRGGQEAFMVWGERKELFGKNAITVAKDRDTGAGGYSVVYEFSEGKEPAGAGKLLDARLVSGTETVTGLLVNDKTVQDMNAALAAKEITLVDHDERELSKVFNVASFPDGKLLIQILNKDELYLGTPGNYTKLDAQLVARGGTSNYYKLADGDSIELPYGYGGPGNNVPVFKGQELEYLDVRLGEDPKKFGLDLAAQKPWLDPFSPQLKTTKPAKPPVP